MSNETITVLNSVENRIYELNWKIRCLQKNVNELHECLDVAVRKNNYGDASLSAHELATVYTEMQNCKNERAYLEKQLDKYQ